VQYIFIFSLIYIIDHGQAKTSAVAVFLIYQLCSRVWLLTQ
jgi:hypothetical protein